MRGAGFTCLSYFQVYSNLFHFSEIVQSSSSAESERTLDIVKSAHVRISDNVLDNLKIFWDMCHCHIQRISKEDGISFLRIFLNIRQPQISFHRGPSLDTVRTGLILCQYINERYRLGLFSDSTAQQEIGRTRFLGQPTPTLEEGR